MLYIIGSTIIYDPSILSEEEKAQAVAVESLPAQECPDGYYAVIASGDGKVWWEYYPDLPDSPSPQALEQIAELKEQLAQTDYKVIKCAEYSLANLELPYDMAALNAERQAIRDAINTLEGSIV